MVMTIRLLSLLYAVRAAALLGGSWPEFVTLFRLPAGWGVVFGFGFIFSPPGGGCRLRRRVFSFLVLFFSLRGGSGPAARLISPCGRTLPSASHFFCLNKKSNQKKSPCRGLTDGPRKVLIRATVGALNPLSATRN